ncbi:hypothetical protein MLD38_020962 [Melastoma candidum]|uniref:Uncharacterized protein n=1 Tax=Melastoma candidum TaxID=119954 RepID=A0ACB9QEN6_9MYRT|nr:hypothetical protein MLD38_020962 [Melastoma candidum]
MGQQQRHVENGSSAPEAEPLLLPPSSSGEPVGDRDVTPFAHAGLLSKFTFWWLNPLLKKGSRKILDEDDIPLLRPQDRAESCYLRFTEQLRGQMTDGKVITSRSILLAVWRCLWKEILVSGLCALAKVVTLATGPLFLRAFIEVAEGSESFKYEGYVLAVGLFLTKCVESLSERQWFFRTRLIGLEIRSFLLASVFRKQLRLSNVGNRIHSPGEVVSYVTTDAYNIGEFPYWFHQIWSTSLQFVLALAIVYCSIGVATISALVGIILIVLVTSPMAKQQLKYQLRLTEAQGKRLKVLGESLTNMRVLKLYAWETHFKKVVECLRDEEFTWISSVLAQKGYYLILFWSSPVLVPAITFWTCYLVGIPLTASSVFTFLASLRIVQEPIRLIPDVVGVFIQAHVSLTRIIKFLNAPELENRQINQNIDIGVHVKSLVVNAAKISWDTGTMKANLSNINLVIERGQKIAICGEVGSGKSTLLASVLGEVPYIEGTVSIHGSVAYVSQMAWIQTGTVQENILFGLDMDPVKYHETIRRCSLTKDIKMFPFGDQTLIGEKGVNLSGGQKQRIQLARALYQDADIYLLDDPFSAVDAHTATSLFKDYVIESLSGKTVLLVTHQVDFLPTFNSILLMSSGQVMSEGSYTDLMSNCREFQVLVAAHTITAGIGNKTNPVSSCGIRDGEIQRTSTEETTAFSQSDQLIQQEEREVGDAGLKPYLQYLKHSNGFFLFALATIAHATFIVGQLAQSYWLAINVDSSEMNQIELNVVYTGIGVVLAFVLLIRSLFVTRLGCRASKSIFATLLQSLTRAPMSFYDSTPLGRILSRVSSDLNILDVDAAFKLTIAVGSTMNTYFSFMVLVILTWPTIFVVVPLVYLTIIIQKYYYASAKELMRLDGTTKSALASNMAESIAGAITIRAFNKEDQFFEKSLQLIDANASPYFHSFSANEWLIQRLEILATIVLTVSALTITVLQFGSSKSGYIGMALAYGLSLNIFLVVSVQFQCQLSNLSISIERLEQYMHIQSEAPEVIETNRPAQDWPLFGNIEIKNLKVRYRPGAPLVLHGINCRIQGGHKVGIVGRTGSGKTTLISTLFRLVEPSEGKIVIDDIDISLIGLQDLRSHFGIIPQDPTLFGGSVRYNLDPLGEYTEHEIWEVLEKCQLRETIQEKEGGLDASVLQDGSNWSMGQRQLFCLGRALLRKSRILVLDEATASVDNATDTILQRTIRKEFAECTVITVAHRIPTVMDCTMVMSISDGRLVEYEDPRELIQKDESLFGQLYKEYWSRGDGGGDA